MPFDLFMTMWSESWWQSDLINRPAEMGKKLINLQEECPCYLMYAAIQFRWNLVMLGEDEICDTTIPFRLCVCLYQRAQCRRVSCCAQGCSVRTVCRRGSRPSLCFMPLSRTRLRKSNCFGFSWQQALVIHRSPCCSSVLTFLHRFYYYYNHFMAFWILSGTTWVSR